MRLHPRVFLTSALCLVLLFLLRLLRRTTRITDGRLRHWNRQSERKQETQKAAVGISLVIGTRISGNSFRRTKVRTAKLLASWSACVKGTAPPLATPSSVRHESTRSEDQGSFVILYVGPLDCLLLWHKNVFLNNSSSPSPRLSSFRGSCHAKKRRENGATHTSDNMLSLAQICAQVSSGDKQADRPLLSGAGWREAAKEQAS